VDSEVLALLVRAKDEASANFNKIEHNLGQLISKAGVGEKVFGSLHSILQGIGVGIGIDIFQSLEGILSKITGLIPELIGKGQDFAQTVEQIQRATGASAESASHFAGQMEYLGKSTEGLSLRLGIMTKGIIAHEAELNKLGVSIRDENGNFLDQITIVERARSALSGMQDGIAKTALATKLFGRAGADMIDWLNLSDAQVGILNGKLDQLGVTMSQAMVDNAREARHEGNLLDLAMQGLGNTLLANVAPALTTAIDSIVNFVQQNGQAIATFASEVVNFVLGMIGALTGATVQTVSFTGEIAAAGNATQTFNQGLESTAEKHKKAAGGAKAHTAALDEQIATIDRELAHVKALETEQDQAYQKQMHHLDAELGRQLDLLSAQEKAHSIAEQQAGQAQQMADAQAALASAQAGGDPAAIESAQRQISAVAQQQADLQMQIADDARRAQIKGVQDYVDAITKAETDWTSKKGLLEQLKKDQATLNSQLAAAQQAGDVQKVADLTIELKAVETTKIRAQQGVQNTDRQTDLEKQKAHFEDLKKAASSAGATIAKVMTDGATTAGVAITKLAGDTNSEMHGIAAAVADQKTGVAGAMETARLAGMKFGADMKTVLAGIVADIGTILGLLGQLAGALDKAALGAKFLMDPGLQDQVKKSGGIPVVSGGLDLLGGLGDLIRPLEGLNPFERHDTGGVIGGKRGEPQLVIAHGGERVTPNGASGTGAGGATVTFQPGSIVVNGVQDPAQIARELVLHVKRELTSQGISFASGY
jgi:hypothetical protein